MNYRLIIATVILSLMVGVVQKFSLVLAQTDPVVTESPIDPKPSDPPSETTNVTEVVGVTEARPLVLDQERAQIKQQYRIAAENYQQSYREYTLAKAQFQKLGTIAALEEAVLDTRQALLDRNRLLMIFFDLIHLELRAAAGVEPEKKQEALRKIESIQTEFESQEQLIQNSQDRVALVARVRWFLDTAENLRANGFYVRALILSGRLYTGYQQALSLYEETKAFHQSQAVDSFMTAQRQRAYNEVDAQIDVINNQWLKIQELLFEKGNQDQNWFQRILPLLSTQQSNLIRLYSYIEELARQ